MSGPNVPAFTRVMSIKASALLLLIAKETSSADNAKNRIQILLLNVALNQVTNISISLSNSVIQVRMDQGWQSKLDVQLGLLIIRRQSIFIFIFANPGRGGP